MTDERQLKLQAFIDGELPEVEAREVASWLARDADATALLTELRNTRKALKDFEPGLKLPESREFFWSKIERQIQQMEPVAAGPQPVPLFARLRRILVPVGALAAVVLAGVLAERQFNHSSSTMAGPSAAGPDTELTLADAGTFTYHDYERGTTLVWVSYPAE